jgi:hypothetical protein
MTIPGIHLLSGIQQLGKLIPIFSNMRPESAITKISHSPLYGRIGRDKLFAILCFVNKIEAYFTTVL